MFDFARRVCRGAASECDKKFASAVASAKTVAAVERLTRADRRLAATAEQWDADPWLLNTPVVFSIYAWVSVGRTIQVIT